MGYLSRVIGEIKITPPLNWAEYKTSDYQLNIGDLHATPIVLAEDIDITHTNEGTTTIRKAVAIVPRTWDRASFYDLDKHLKNLAEEFGFGHTFTGALIRVGEETGDIERYRFEGLRLVTERAVLSWPDGTRIDPDEL